MKAWTRIWLFLLACLWASACVAAAANPTVDAAIQAIQQAPDPSAAVTAYANGFALDRNNPRLYDAYVARMVDLGLPEMAYHQAQTLTTLQANNGLAWGVVGYVDARRAQMPEALSAINLASQYAPDNKFVQHTAGELAAWYDLKADKATIPENTKDGLTKTRTLLGQRPAFTEAYSTAQKAYQTGSTPQPAAAAPAAPAAAPQSRPESVATNAAAPYPTVPNAPEVPMAPQVPAEQPAAPAYAVPASPPAYPPDYYGPYYSPDYYAGAYLDWGPSYGYAWGPGWVAPAPWWWWQPCGFWGGFSFFPFGTVFVFDFDHHDHHDHHHDGHSHHNEQFAHGGTSGHAHDPAFWHNGSKSQTSFFGTPARPSDSTLRSAQATATARPASTQNAFAPALNARNWSSTRQSSALATTSGGTRSMTPSMFGRSSTVSTPTVRPGSVSSSAFRAPATTPNPWPFLNNNSARSYAAPRTAWSAPSYHAPAYSAPHYSFPSQSFAGGYRGWQGGSGYSVAPHSFSSSSGGFQNGGAFGGGFHSSGAMGGGAFHGGGGAFSGGGHGGGGHR